MSNTTPSIAAVLGRIPLFASLSEAQRQQLAASLRAQRCAANECIVQIDDSGDSFYYILSGRVKVVRRLPGGREVVVGLLGPGEFFGEQALLDGGPRAASIFTVEQTVVLMLMRDDFLRFVRSDINIAMSMLATLSERIRKLNAQVEEAYSMSLNERLAKRILALSEAYGEQSAGGVMIKAALTLDDLAQMVGATRQQISKPLQDWQNSGTLRISWNEEIVILNPEDLHRVK